MSNDHDQPRNLTDADVEAIVDASVKRFYTLIGQGFMSMVWKGALAIAVLLATYGMIKSK